MAKQKTDTERTLVTFLLDRTGSMESIRDDTIGAFNAYLDGLQDDSTANGAKIDFTLVQFDSQSLDKVCVSVPIAQVDRLTKATYQPRASTPLIDAAYKTIKAVEASLNGSKPKVVICIQTDGQENSSTEHTWAELHALIKEKTALGWQFNFMGCGIDAYAQGQKMGIAAMASMSYDRNDAAKTMSAFRSSARNIASFAAGLSSTTDYSASDRQAAGDAFDPANQAPPTVATGKGNTKSRTPTPAAVDDFTL